MTKKTNNLINSLIVSHIESYSFARANQQPNNIDDMYMNVLYISRLFCSLANIENIKKRIAEINKEKFNFNRYYFQCQKTF
jgi:hypothetical protein